MQETRGILSSLYVATSELVLSEPMTSCNHNLERRQEWMMINHHPDFYTERSVIKKSRSAFAQMLLSQRE